MRQLNGFWTLTGMGRRGFVLSWGGTDGVFEAACVAFVSDVGVVSLYCFCFGTHAETASVELRCHLSKINVNILYIFTYTQYAKYPD